MNRVAIMTTKDMTMTLRGIVPRHDVDIDPQDGASAGVRCRCGNYAKQAENMEEARLLALIHLIQSQTTEPVFVFRASDVALPEILNQYHDKIRHYGSPARKLHAVMEHRQRILEWQEKHSYKVPD